MLACVRLSGSLQCREEEGINIITAVEGAVAVVWSAYKFSLEEEEDCCLNRARKF